MTCPLCQAPLTAREYAWTHVHPTVAGRVVGALLMGAGLGSVAAGIAKLIAS